MKTIKRVTIILSAIIVILSNGCEDFLAENPKTFINPEDFYQNQADVESGLTGIYAGFPDSWYWLINHHIHSENTWPWQMDIHEVGYTRNSPDVSNYYTRLWQPVYNSIMRANTFINQLEDKEVDFSESLKERYLGEARFIRAYLYYSLVQNFGDVPLVTQASTSTNDIFVEKTPASDIWEFIKADLDQAIQTLPPKSEYSGPDVSRANREAAKMLLAKTYMVEQNWSGAGQLVDEIIASGEYALEEDIMDNWRTSNEHGKESIYEVDFGEGFSPNQASNLGNILSPPGLIHPITGGSVSGSWGGAAYAPQFYNSFEDSDVRRTALFIDTALYSAPEGKYYSMKYWAVEEQVQTVARSPVNWAVFRYADVLLMKAEIENELNNGPTAAAYDAIDMVKIRSNASLINRNLNYDQFLHAVFDERAKELFFEGHRFWDLKRRGFDFLESRVEPARQALFDHVGYETSYDIQEYQLVLPIPAQELDANPNLEQNEGY